ncbi:pyridoxamine 5-phosphate oxidase [Rhodococcus ruber Chol-4]|uniref:Fmn flavoprotein n=1 Tax=Rhodococcus ruber TaxID=1830 RepID=A0A098BRK3_9NOCA|nr:MULTISPECIES: pyridoxamine 5'-phosphate oxidase family protein [Rhodococcus]RIK03077.1 MAG: pyridoxamine 5'-phosphate oxidase family protein [Acidobacteriota bacterium]AUM19520.1 pyridoxamine 5'-phosphate oxidase family protein [Rhodococcus ruber]AWG97364.1 pyridoxamine 5'-phosphate oxidase family protein [Rhodococcus ruber]KXF83783.1 pyridoxamine 5-phosphate oxidase [Rhodococcus ruber Chol-4]MBP2214541.1 nitroimidazol reductase NimA-like FMN-containing flavoprotein (pyridoxamine 5'-phospha
MSEPNIDDPVVVLSDEESWELLGTERIGRLVVVSDGRPDVFPINFAVRDRKLYFRTAEGSKLVELTLNAEVAFEADHVEQDRAWSVVLHGRARNLVRYNEIQEAEELGLQAWVPTPKYNFVEVTASEISGRRFALVKD